MSPWSDFKLAEQIKLLNSDPSYWDKEDTLEFCIALAERDIALKYSIADNLMFGYKKAAETSILVPENTATLNEFTSGYFNKYVKNDRRSIGEWFSIFFRDTSDTLQTFRELQHDHVSIKNIAAFERGAAENRYFSDNGSWRYFRSAFAERVKKFKQNETQEGFEYFLNVIIPMSQRFYDSGYPQAKTGKSELEDALRQLYYKRPENELQIRELLDTPQSRNAFTQFFREMVWESIVLGFFSMLFKKDKKEPKDN